MVPTQQDVQKTEAVAAVLMRELHAALASADRSLRRGQFMSVRQAIEMTDRPMALLAALLHVDLDAP